MCAHLLTLLCQLTLISFPYTIAVMQSDTENAQQPFEKVKCNIGAMRPHSLLPWPIEKQNRKANTQTNVQQLLALNRCFVYLLNLVKLIGDCVCFCFRYGHARSGLSHIVCSNHQTEKESTPRVTEGHIGAPPPPCGPGPSAEGPGRGSPAPPWSTAAAVGSGAVRQGARAGDRPHRLGAPLPPCGPG